jgi:hypothetical protein
LTLSGLLKGLRVLEHTVALLNCLKLELNVEKKSEILVEMISLIKSKGFHHL